MTRTHSTTSPPHTAPVAFVLKGYPRLSETFIAQEILALQQRGLPIQIISLRHPTDKKQHPVNHQIDADVNYLPEYLYQEPRRVWNAWRTVRRLPGYGKSRSTFLADLKRDRTPNRIRRFGQAMVLAAELPKNVRQIHAHFMHTPASVTRYAAIMRSLPWSCSAHAKDIWTIEQWEKEEKLQDCEWMVTCTAFNAAHLKSLTTLNNVELVYHGLDLDRFSSPTSTPPATESAITTSRVIKLVSVGRAVEKKGYDILLRALAILTQELPQNISWHFDHIGGGPLLGDLKALAAELKLDAQITWHGALDQSEVIQRYRNADIFVLPCRITADGDRDGLPNVLMEAQSQGLACLSTSISGVPELIIEGETGLMVDAEDEAAFASQLKTLMMDSRLRHTLAKAGQKRVQTHFSMAGGIDQLARRFELPRQQVVKETDQST